MVAVVILLTPVLVSADQYGIEDTAKNTSLQKISITKKYQGNLSALIGDIVAAGLGLVGVVFFGLILYGGIIWMTAMGKTEQAEKAKDILEKAIVGLVIVGASYAISNFVFSSLTGKGGAGGAGGGGGCCISSGNCNSAITDADVCSNSNGKMVSDCSSQCQSEH